MAQTNFTPILTYKSDTATSVPAAGDLTNSANGAELAVNTADKRLFTKDSGGNVVEVGTNPSSLTMPNGTANGVIYANGSKVLTSGSALTFDGTTFLHTGQSSFATGSGNVMIGSGSTDAKLRVVDAAGNGIRIGFLSGSSNLNLYDATSHIFRNAGGTGEYATLNSTGLGIGTSSPGAKLDVAGSGYIRGDSTNATFTSAGQLAIKRSTSSPFMSFHGDTGTRLGYIQMSSSADSSIVVEANQALVFANNNTERARIDTSGNLLVGTTTASGKLFSSTSSATQPALRAASTSATYNDNVFAIDVDRNTTNNTFYAISYYNNGAAAHKFRVADSGNVTNTNNSYGAISDVKLKENIVDATPKLAALQNVRIVNYNRIGSEEKELGVIAQELEQVFPALVETHIDRDAEGNDLGTTTKSVKYSVFVPMLIKAIQELKAEFDAYKASHP